MWKVFFISFIVLQRFAELIIARSNERWIKQRGGIEIGRDHYKWFIVLHLLFFIILLSELLLLKTNVKHLNFSLFSIFLITQCLRVWCMYSLGRFWNTKIIVIPNLALIKHGPYKYVKHPNYIIVAIELLVIPLIVGAYITALIFPVLHILLINVRIPIEEEALALK